MKRRFSHTTPRQGLLSSPARLATAALLCVLLLLLLLRLIAPGAFTSLATPFWHMGSSFTGTVGNTVSLDTRASLQNDRDRLMRENDALKQQNATLAARATDLERLLGGRAETPGGILAGVLARPPVSPYDLLVINRGSSAGIIPGATAFGPGGVPLGTVADVERNSARVSLYSTTGRVVDAWAGANRIPVQLTGTGAGGYDAEVPGTAGILVGDLIYVPGPGALPIGTVIEVVTNPSSPSVVLRIRSMVNPLSLTWITVASSVPAAL